MNIPLSRRHLPLSAMTLLCVSLAGQAASFDCAKASSVTETTICANERLSSLDSELSAAWKRISGTVVDPATLKSSQLQWLKRRNACAADAACLSDRYNERLDVLFGTQPALESDQAGNRLEALMAKSQEASASTDKKWCTADGDFCTRILKKDGGEDNGSSAQIEIDSRDASPPPYRFALPNNDLEDASVTLWPYLLRLAGDSGTVVVGVELNVSTGYSGGGASASELQLFEVRRGGASREVLSIPIDGHKLIRACFSEEDARRRLDACHDEYQFTGVLRLDRTVKSGFPQLVYQTRATSFPGNVSLDKDSSDGPPLNERDIVTVVTPNCTYKRTFHWHVDKGVYVADQPLPDCSDFTVP